MNNKSNDHPEYSQEREWRVILEDLRSQFRVFGEDMKDVKQRLGSLEDDMVTVKEDIKLIKTAIPNIFSRLGALEAKR